MQVLTVFNLICRKNQLQRNATGKVFRKDIQALRAFAVASVVLYHLWPNRLGGGFTGVDIFFVISGYLMTTSIMYRLTPMAREHNINVRSVFGLMVGFYSRRIKRLVPAALATLVVTTGLAYITGNLTVLLTNVKNVLAASTFWQNWYLAKDSLNYLQQDNLVVATQHFWSLSLEEQFYLAWPLFLVVGTLLTTGLALSWKKRNIHAVILPVVLATLVSIAYGVYITKAEPTVAYYDTYGRVWELMVGGIIALLPAIKNYDLKLLLPYIGLAIDMCSVYFVSADGFPGWSALLPVIGTAMIIWGGVDRAASRLSFDQVFKWRPIQWLGDISYSVYLWHFPIIILLPILVHHDINGAHGRLFKISIIILSLIVAHISFKLIEQPFMRHKPKLKYIYIAFIVATAIVAGGSIVLKHSAQHRIDSALKQMHAQALVQSNECFGARAILHQKKCGNPYGSTHSGYMAVAMQDNFRRLIKNGKICTKFSRQANAKEHWHDYKKVCVVGDVSATETISVIGDSHADQYMNAFDALGRKHHIKIYIYDIVSCNPWSTTISDPNCKKRLSYIDHAHEIHSSGAIITSFFYHNYDFISKMEQHIKNNFPKKRILLLKDNATITQKNLNDCYTTSLNCYSPRAVALHDSSMITKKLVKNNIIAKNNIIDTGIYLCDKNNCYSSIGGVPVYFKSRKEGAEINSHISASFSYSLGPLMAQQLYQHKILN